MANSWLADQVYSNTMLLLVKNQLTMGKLVDGQFKNEVADTNGLKTYVKRPPRYELGTGEAIDTQDSVIGSVNVAVDQYSHVHLKHGDLESSQSVNALMHNAEMISAATTLANGVDKYLQAKTLQFNGSVGTWGTDITTPQMFNAVHTRLMDNGVPDDGNINSTVLYRDGEKIRGSLIGTYIQGVNSDALSRVKIPVLSDINLYATQMCPALTVGTRVAAATTLINGASQNVNYRDVKDVNTQTLIVDGETGTYVAGEVFTIAGVYAWDNRAGAALDYLQQFTVVTGRTGAGAITISPPIIVRGTNDGTDTKTNSSFATVSAAPADNAALTFLGAAGTSTRVRSAWHKRAIALVSAPLRMPDTGNASFQTDPETGISIRYWRGSDISTANHYVRFDMIYGAAVTDPTLGAHVFGS